MPIMSCRQPGFVVDHFLSVIPLSGGICTETANDEYR